MDLDPVTMCGHCKRPIDGEPKICVPGRDDTEPCDFYHEPCAVPRAACYHGVRQAIRTRHLFAAQRGPRMY